MKHSARGIRIDLTRLQRSLEDCESGKMLHLSEAERDQIIAGLKRRIADLNAELTGAGGA